MNSERKAFCEYIKNEYNDDNPIEWLDGKPIKGLHLMLWNSWQASTQRQGCKLVPVDVLERAISHISIAMCHPNNTRNEEDIMHNDMVIIEKAMIGAVDEE